MAAEAQKIHRLLELQRQMHQIEEWKLANLDRTLEDLAVSQRELIQALNEDDALQGLFIDATARHIQKLSEETSRVAIERTAQSARLLDQAVRKGCAERLAADADRRAAETADKKQLLDVIERVLGPAAQASRKITEG